MPRILIVDDEPNIVLSLEFLMKHEGWETEVAQDGERAIEAVARQPPDLVILDVMLPGLSGFDVCERIRAGPGGRDVRIMMLTAKGRDAEIARGMRAGADVYVTKPFSTRELVEHVRRLLGGAGQDLP